MLDQKKFVTFCGPTFFNAYGKEVYYSEYASYCRSFDFFVSHHSFIQRCVHP